MGFGTHFLSYRDRYDIGRNYGEYNSGYNNRNNDYGNYDQQSSDSGSIWGDLKENASNEMNEQMDKLPDTAENIAKEEVGDALVGMIPGANVVDGASKLSNKYLGEDNAISEGLGAVDGFIDSTVGGFADFAGDVVSSVASGIGNVAKGLVNGVANLFGFDDVFDSQDSQDSYDREDSAPEDLDANNSSSSSSKSKKGGKKGG